MNFVSISPNFPRSYWNFCDRLKKNGVTVLAIADEPYETLPRELKNAVTEYYRVASLEDYGQVMRAMGYFIFKYGRIDWVESNNEYWLELDARLRTDFNITTGMKSAALAKVKSKAGMKEFYRAAGVPVARYHMVSDLQSGLAFIQEVGWPVIVKPDVGVGAEATYKLENRADAEAFYQSPRRCHYIMEEFIPGIICSYDGVANAQAEVIFETGNVFPVPIMDIVNTNGHLAYWTRAQLPPALADAGRRTVKAFGVKSRFFHLEFFQLTQDKPGLGQTGDFVALEVNLRPAGGYTPDMINYANSVDAYQIWADMVAFGECRVNLKGPKYFCVYASRRDGKPYRHTHGEVMAKYAAALVMAERMPDALSGAMGNQMYTARLATEAARDEFIRFVQEEME